VKARTDVTASEDVAAITEELRASRKYRHVAGAALTRIAGEALRGARDRADAVKRAKRKLHQVFAAFVTAEEIARAEQILGALPDDPAPEAVRAACREILRRHSSTRERVVASTREPDGAWYAQLWKITGVPRVVVDLGCGFHPFALPWMGLPKGCEYLACDVDERIAALVSRLFKAFGQHGRAVATDLLGAAHADALLDASVDVAFLMKLLPTLERQAAGGAARLVDTVRAHFLVVTVPARSLGGRERGMAAHYEAFVQALIERPGAARFDRAVRIDGDEPTWVLKRRPAP
jgi:16S rRNA (guanine(1405)-N(7))-methyltransferase